MTERRNLAGFSIEAQDEGFVIHIVDDAGEVFEIEASRENVELIVSNLETVLAGGSGESNHAQG